MRAFILLLFLSLSAQAQTVPKFPAAGLAAYYARRLRDRSTARH